MSDSIVAALISAGAAIAVAMIGKYSPGPGRPGARLVSGSNRPPRSWLVTIGLLLIWLLVSPGAIHHDFVGTNYFVAPAVLVVLALINPIRPVTAAWTSLAVFATNFLLGPLGNRLAGSHYDTGIGLEPEKYPTLILLILISTTIVAGVCAFRLRMSRVAAVTPPTPESSTSSDPPGSASLTADLRELSALHKSGALSDEEFRQAKARLLR